MSYILKNEAELHKLAKKFATKLTSGDVILLYGEMGSGKTTFVKAVCEELNVKQNVSSPTFTLINKYETATGQTIYHVDLYRLNSALDLYMLDLHRYLTDPSAIIFIEWAEKLEELIPDQFLKLTFEYYETDQRQLSYAAQGARYQNLITAWN
jgi:tRNA threonylcarbamoyladenosine biosynthesis protein TsaE